MRINNNLLQTNCTFPEKRWRSDCSGDHRQTNQPFLQLLDCNMERADIPKKAMDGSYETKRRRLL